MIRPAFATVEPFAEPWEHAAGQFIAAVKDAADLPLSPRAFKRIRGFCHQRRGEIAANPAAVDGIVRWVLSPRGRAVVRSMCSAFVKTSGFISVGTVDAIIAKFQGDHYAEDAEICQATPQGGAICPPLFPDPEDPTA